MTNGWKVTAIVFIILFLLIVGVFTIGYVMIQKEEKQTLQCYYDVCAEYPDASIEDGGLCICYDYDLLGELSIVKTELLN